MTPQDYDFLRKILKERSGLDLSADKQYLVESRLIPLTRRAGLPGIPELVAKIKSGAEALTSEVVEAMTTNETFFFRDKIPFDQLRETILPALVQARASRRSLRIWCAASSTGQEPYSIAMCVKEFAGLAGWRVEIVATDLSQEVLEKSKAGLYSQFEVQRGLPIQTAGQVLCANRRAVAAQCRDPRHGTAPPAQPAAGLFSSRHVRRDLLPQRADLFRPGHKDRDLRAVFADAGVRWRAGAGRGRIGRWNLRRLQALSGSARTLSAETPSAPPGAVSRPPCRRY